MNMFHELLLNIIRLVISAHSLVAIEYNSVAVDIMAISAQL